MRRARVGIVHGFAQDEVVDGHRRVGAKNGRGRQAAGLQAREGRVELGGGDAGAVGLGQFASAHGLQRLGVFVGAGQQQLVLDAELVQQLTTTWALRGEVDELTHGGTGGRW